MMKFDDALLHAAAYCESRGTDDPFSLYCALCDAVGADFAGKEAAGMLFKIDKRIRIVKNIKEDGKLACVISKAAYPAFQSQYGKREFCGFIDDLYCVLTHTPREARQSAKKCVAFAKKGTVCKKKIKGKGKVPAPVRPNAYAQIPPNIPPKYYGIWLLRHAIDKK